jgi:hypothetical protein
VSLHVTGSVPVFTPTHVLLTEDRFLKQQRPQLQQQPVHITLQLQDVLKYHRASNGTEAAPNRPPHMLNPSPAVFPASVTSPRLRAICSTNDSPALPPASDVRLPAIHLSSAFSVTSVDASTRDAANVLHAKQQRSPMQKQQQHQQPPPMQKQQQHQQQQRLLQQNHPQQSTLRTAAQPLLNLSELLPKLQHHQQAHEQKLQAHFLQEQQLHASVASAVPVVPYSAGIHVPPTSAAAAAASDAAAVCAAAAAGISVLIPMQAEGEDDDDLLLWCSRVEEEKRRLDAL